MRNVRSDRLEGALARRSAMSFVSNLSRLDRVGVCVLDLFRPRTNGDRGSIEDERGSTSERNGLDAVRLLFASPLVEVQEGGGGQRPRFGFDGGSG